MDLQYIKLKLFTDHLDEGGDITIVPDTKKISELDFELIAARLEARHCVFLLADEAGSNKTSIRTIGPMNIGPLGGPLGDEGFDANALLGATLGLSHKIRASSARLNYQGHNITCVYDRVDKNTGDMQFMMPQLPQLCPTDISSQTIADALGLQPQDIGHATLGHPCFYQLGIDYHLVPLKDPELLAQIKLQRRGWADIFGQNTPSVCVYAPMHEDEEGTHIAARVFGAQYPNWEHQADGTSALTVAAQCARKLGLADGQHQFHVHQGQFLGANRHVQVRIFVQNGQIGQLSVGGRALIVAQGALTV